MDSPCRKMRAMGDRVTQDQTDPQYMFLRQRLAGLQEGWEELQRMWDNRQHLLSQGLNLQVRRKGRWRGRGWGWRWGMEGRD